MAFEQSRVILNFSHQCALHCPWCYVPFGGPAARVDTVESVVDRIAELGFDTLTIGGGDPFQYSFIGSVIDHAKRNGLLVHVDTHGRSLRHTMENRLLIERAVNLIGLPLDGPNSLTHDGMRNAPGHFEIVLQRLAWLNEMAVNVKINTLVSRKNIDAIVELSEVVRAVAPARWSLYQYWPVGPAAAVDREHSLDDSIFAQVANRVIERLGQCSTVLEVSPRDMRRATYPIVHHDGSVFVHNSSPGDSFQLLGSIFEANILAAIASACGRDRPEAAQRYR